MTETPSRPAEPPADWLTFHLTHPTPDAHVEPYDPNACFFWAGRYHFHYVYPSDDGLAYAHVSSPDLVHWTWHPTTLTASNTGHEILSGSGFLTKEGRPAIIYAARFGMELGPEHMKLGSAQIVISEDDQLEKWSAPIAIEPRVSPGADGDLIVPWDPHGWLEGDTYYALFGRVPGGTGKAVTLHRSADLVSWDYVGPLMTTDLPDAAEDTDISCPEFFPLGNEHMLLCISHNRGCRYYLGEWNDEQFTPTRHGRMNWQPPKWALDGLDTPDAGRAVFFAPETLLTPDGRRVMWAWAWVDGLQAGIQSLPRELSLPDDGILRITPLRELQILRTDEMRITDLELPSTGPQVIENVAGDALECAITFHRGPATRFGATVLCDADGTGGLPITVDTAAGTLAIGDVEAPFTVVDDTVTLRIFIDKGLIEAFADDRQAVIGTHPYNPDNVSIALFADAPITADITAWRLNSAYTKETR